MAVGLPVGRLIRAEGHQQVGIPHPGAGPVGEVLLSGHDIGFGVAQELLHVVVQAGLAEVLGGCHVVEVAFGRVRQAEAARAWDVLAVAWEVVISHLTVVGDGSLAERVLHLGIVHQGAILGPLTRT